MSFIDSGCNFDIPGRILKKTGAKFCWDRNGTLMKSSKTVMTVGVVTLGISYAIGRIDFFPEPAGLVLSLVGLLVTTNGIYVWLSSSGPLSPKKESGYMSNNNQINLEEE